MTWAKTLSSTAVVPCVFPLSPWYKSGFGSYLDQRQQTSILSNTWALESGFPILFKTQPDNLVLIPDGVNLIFIEFMPMFYIAPNGTKARLIVLLIIRRRRNYLIVEQSSAVNYCDSVLW